MIAGVGTDIIDVERIAAKINKDSGFKELVFSQNEMDYCEKKAHKAEHYAARFAAKEAFFKAIGTGWADGTAFNEVEITNDTTGKPSLNLIGATKKKLDALEITKIWVSLSHIKTMATAVVIIEK